MQQEIFGPTPSRKCKLCGRPLSNLDSVMRGIGPVCNGHHGQLTSDEMKQKHAFEDIETDHDLIKEGIVLQRSADGRVMTNVPHLVVHHSPTGFEYGYSGSGPSDLALNVCEWYLRRIGFEGQEVKCFAGHCLRAAWVLHHELKFKYLATLDRDGTHVLPYRRIKEWIDRRLKTYTEYEEV